MNHTNHKVLLWSASLLWAVTFGCRERVEPETPDYVKHGWELMAEQDYSGAIPHFEEGTVLDIEYADAWNGLGWAYAKLDSAEASAENFVTGAGLGDSTVVGTEILAGLAFSKLALGEFVVAVDSGKAALSREKFWEFEHDATLNYLHLRLTIATGFFGVGEFDSSLVWVKLIDGTYNNTLTTLSERYDLAVKLEDLRENL